MEVLWNVCVAFSLFCHSADGESTAKEIVELRWKWVVRSSGVIGVIICCYLVAERTTGISVCSDLNDLQAKNH